MLGGIVLPKYPRRRYPAVAPADKFRSLIIESEGSGLFRQGIFAAPFPFLPPCREMHLKYRKKLDPSAIAFWLPQRKPAGHCNKSTPALTVSPRISTNLLSCIQYCLCLDSDYCFNLNLYLDLDLCLGLTIISNGAMLALKFDFRLNSHISSYIQ